MYKKVEKYISYNFSYLEQALLLCGLKNIHFRFNTVVDNMLGLSYSWSILVKIKYENERDYALQFAWGHLTLSGSVGGWFFVFSSSCFYNLIGGDLWGSAFTLNQITMLFAHVLLISSTLLWVFLSIFICPGSSYLHDKNILQTKCFSLDVWKSDLGIRGHLDGEERSMMVPSSKNDCLVFLLAIRSWGYCLVENIFDNSYMKKK